MTEKLYKMVNGESIEMSQKEADEIRAEWACNDVIQKSTEYIRLRESEYPSIREQLDMLFHDKINGTNNWMNCIKAIKDKYPSN